MMERNEIQRLIPLVCDFGKDGKVSVNLVIKSFPLDLAVRNDQNGTIIGSFVVGVPFEDISNWEFCLYDPEGQSSSPVVTIEEAYKQVAGLIASRAAFEAQAS